MLKKTNIYFCVISAICYLSTPAFSYDIIEKKDEALLKDIIDETTITHSSSTSSLTSNPYIQPSLSEDLEEIENTKPEDVIPSSKESFYPTKEERAQNRYEEKEWFKPRVKEIIQPNSLANIDENDPYLEEIKSSIHDCLNNKQNELDIGQTLLKEGNIYNNTAYLSQTFEDINTCYENIGYNIISLYYNDNEWTLQNYKQKLKTFYVSSSDAKFDTTYCTENCSLDAMVKNQINQFKLFRTYLSELLANRPQKRK